MSKKWVKQWALPGLTLFLSICLVVVLVSSCSNAPVQPTGEDTTQLTLQWLQTNCAPGGPSLSSGTLDYLKTDPNYIDDAEVAARVGPKGGSLTINLDNEDIIFVVPAGALYSDVKIDITAYKMRTPYGDLYLYECEPAGTVFLRPMWVDHPVNRVEGAASGLFYLNDIEATWEVQQVSPVEDGRARFEIRHFSKYGIS